MADPAGHVAVEFQIFNNSEELLDGLPPLGAHTAYSSRNLGRTNTRDNMPSVSFQYVCDMEMSPAGKLLAVGGSDGFEGGGLQVFHFKGGNPSTP